MAEILKEFEGFKSNFSVQEMSDWVGVISPDLPKTFKGIQEMFLFISVDLLCIFFVMPFSIVVCFRDDLHGPNQRKIDEFVTKLEKMFLSLMLLISKNM